MYTDLSFFPDSYSQRGSTNSATATPNTWNKQTDENGAFTLKIFFNSNIPSLLMCRISTGHRVPKSHLLHWIDHFLSTLTCFFFCLSFSLLFWSSSPGRQEFDQKVKQNLIKGRKWSRSIYFCIQTEYRLQVPPFDLLSQMEQYCKLQTTGT